MKSLFIILILLISIPCQAFDKWNTEEIIAQSFSTALTVIDWGQTLYISDHTDKFYEKMNFLLAKHPSRGSVNLYFGASLIVKPMVVHVLPRDYTLWGMKLKPRRIAQSLYIGMSGYNVGHNYSIGIKIGF